MRMLILFGEYGALLYTKAVLLVGDDKPRGGKFNTVTQQGLGADDNVKSPGGVLLGE